MHESENYIIIVTELLKGGTLNCYIEKQNHDKISPIEEEISIIMRQIFLALNYIHSHNYIHRDLKPENILFRRKNDISSLVIIDFGLSLKFHKIFDLLSGSKAGTPCFMSPEQIERRSVSTLSDMWACGVIQYILLNHEHPFYQKNDQKEDVLRKMKEGVRFLYKDSSMNSIHLFNKLCSYELLNRYDSADALNHPFINRDKTSPYPLTFLEERFQHQINNLLNVTSLFIFISQIPQVSQIYQNQHLNILNIKINSKYIRNIRNLKEKSYEENDLNKPELNGINNQIQNQNQKLKSLNFASRNNDLDHFNTINYSPKKRIQVQISKDLIVIKKKNIPKENIMKIKNAYSNTPKSNIGNQSSPKNYFKRKNEKKEYQSPLSNNQKEIMNKYLKIKNIEGELTKKYSEKDYLKVYSSISNNKLLESGSSNEKDSKKNSVHSNNSISPNFRNEETKHKKSTFYTNELLNSPKKNVDFTMAISNFKKFQPQPLSNFKLDPPKIVRKYSVFNIIPFSSMKKTQSTQKLFK